MAWWRDARFGLFIHWGVYAVPGGIHKFETQNLGTLEIEEQGEKNLTIRPDPTDWKPFNLRKITLKPIVEEE